MRGGEPVYISGQVIPHHVLGYLTSRQFLPLISSPGMNSRVSLTYCTEFLTILRLVPYRFRNISRTVMPTNSKTYIALRYFKEIMTEGGLAAV